ncbi:DUF2303 family protein [Oricola indica]|jgi:uncharacterized protein YfdQ (DUF2303 family)|uniref:DUF2303 family protein n=1 Tax=Oricola indica TaxID=2872591 RepID=UPI001CC0B722|nr:DUF2303 family protein [Oricola indica]
MSDKSIPDGLAVKDIADLGKRASDPHVEIVKLTGLGEGLPEQVPLAFNRDSKTFTALAGEVEKYRQMPKRRTGIARADTLSAFCALIDRHKDDDSVIFGETAWPNPKLTAVIDYHSLDHDPKWLGHRIEYAFPLTEEFKAWVECDGKPMEQGDFAAFIEDHAAELASPSEMEKGEFERLFKERFATPSELIMLSRELEVFVGAKAKRGERLSTGERTIEFTTEHKDGKGDKVDIPGVFMVSVPAFVDGEALRIPARLRYRLGGGSIHWFYQLYRWEFWLREQVQRDLQEAGKKTSLPVFEGAPER